MVTIRAPHDPDYIAHRIHAIHEAHQLTGGTRRAVRNILRGGPGAIRELLGQDTKLKDQHLPVVNLMHTNMQRLAIKLGHVPDPKVDVPPGRDTVDDRKKASRLEAIIESLDVRDRLDMKLPWLGRWIPAYGYGFAFVRPCWDPTAEAWYPKIEIRNSYDVYPGWFDADMRCQEVVVTREVPTKTLAAKYPDLEHDLANRRNPHQAFPLTAGIPGGTSSSSQWHGSAPRGDTVTVHELFDPTGRYLYVEETGRVYDTAANTLTRPTFVVPRRFDFEDLTGHFDHMIGLMTMMTKLNILGFIASEDNVFAPTNIIGDPTNSPYRRGRGQVNKFPTGTVVTRGVVDSGNYQQTFQQIDRIERQLRIQGNYPVSEDAQSPNSYVTGRGLSELSSSLEAAVGEYHQVISDALVDIDAIRLEMDDTHFGGKAKPLEAAVAAKHGRGTYDPGSWVRGRYTTRRVYGMMAGWDEPSKIVTGLQLLQAGVIDRQTVRENLYGLDNHQRVTDRIAYEETERLVLAALEQAAVAGDPAAKAAISDILSNPSDRVAIIAKWFKPQEAEAAGEMSPEEAMMAAAGGAPAPGGAPPAISTVLSQLGMSGETKGGVQTVGTL